MYDAGERRFVAVDALKGSVAELISLVQYIYVLDNPINWVDLSGLQISPPSVGLWSDYAGTPPKNHPDETGTARVPYPRGRTRTASIYVPKIVDDSNVEYIVDGYTVETVKEYTWTYIDMQELIGSLLSGNKISKIKSEPEYRNEDDQYRLQRASAVFAAVATIGNNGLWVVQKQKDGTYKMILEKLSYNEYAQVKSNLSNLDVAGYKWTN
jgi:hypothetical protein